jgi:hypothetical protein
VTDTNEVQIGDCRLIFGCHALTENGHEALEERAAIIQFCSGREISRAESERIAAEQMGIDEEEMEFLMGESMEIK